MFDLRPPRWLHGLLLYLLLLVPLLAAAAPRSAVDGAAGRATNAAPAAVGPSRDSRAPEQTMARGARSYGERELPAAAPVRSTIRSPQAEPYRVVRGNVFIVVLEEQLEGRPVRRYRIERAPAMSWLVGRSFAWRTSPADVGPHEVTFTAELTDGATETVRLRVDVL